MNVKDYGAKPNDNQSDREGIEAAISADNKNESGIVFFLKGRFLVNAGSTITLWFFSACCNIIFKGSGFGATGRYTTV